MNLSEEQTAWLGPAAEEMTDDQKDDFARVWDEVGEQFPDWDQADHRAEALNRAVQEILGETSEPGPVRTNLGEWTAHDFEMADDHDRRWE